MLDVHQAPEKTDLSEVSITLSFKTSSHVRKSFGEISAYLTGGPILIHMRWVGDYRDEMGCFRQMISAVQDRYPGSIIQFHLPDGYYTASYSEIVKRMS